MVTGSTSRIHFDGIVQFTQVAIDNRGNKLGSDVPVQQGTPPLLAPRGPDNTRPSGR